MEIIKSIKQDARNSQIAEILACTPAVYLRWQQPRISIAKVLYIIVAVGPVILHDVKKIPPMGEFR